MNLAIDDLYLFESQWEKLSFEKKALSIDDAVTLAPESAILPILAGLTSGIPSLRNKAEKSLASVKLNILNRLADPTDKDQYRNGMKSAASVCAKIYAHIHPDMPFDELKFFFTTLLAFDGKGPYFAFKAVYRGLVPVDAMEEVIFTVPESERLAIVDQYLHTGPAVRLKFGGLFKDILQSIQERESVVQFFAGLFDGARDADPFLNNIRADLRDPDQIISGMIRSSRPEQRIAGLKALSMMVTKISTDLLKDLLADEKDQEVRIAIYNVIEASPVGLYLELCYPILQFFYGREEKEALHAFKAMVVSGKFSPHQLLKIIEAKYPSLLPAIHREISVLSRFSFLIIQDIALNKEKYLNSNFDANLACVLGMIKKRPERIVRILSDHSTSVNVKPFIEKTKKLLAKETKSIETEFDFIPGWINKKVNGSKKSLLALNRKRIEELNKKGDSKPETHFEGDVILNTRFPSGRFHPSPLFFNKSIICKSNLSKAFISDTFFRKSIFCKVDMEEAEFENVNFDNAVFIDVNAAGARFKNCSFDNVSVYNCNFSGADLRDALFLNSTVSKTLFDGTDLSGSCFAYSKISGVSFSNSILHQADFSDVKARFCKFQLSEDLDVRKQNLDFNAREFQLSFKDMPPLEESTVAEVNKQIFCEFIHYGERKFLEQNQLSLLTAFDIFKEKQTDLFQLIPLLLHENIVLPGIESIHPETPCGIWNYLPSLETLEVLGLYLPGEKILSRRSLNPSFEGLFTMGSVGSLAQTSDSDIDYWVCIREKKFNSQDIERLKNKLKILEAMAMDRFDTKVTFFIVDIPRARHNDFGSFTSESSGSAQSRLLKEEFYRTMVYIAGKIPLWAVLPSAISLNYYDIIKNSVFLSQGNSRYMDLGDINAISTSEYFGGSLWQMFKCLKSPFKSVIKMALLEKFLHEYGKELLLCNKYKDEWLNSGAQLKLTQNDSYYILVENLLAHFTAVKDDESVALLLTCFFLKLGISKNSQINDTVFGLRKILLEHCLHRWGWTKIELFRIGRFQTWKYGEIASVSDRIKEYMIKKCKLVNKRFAGQAKISPEDLTVLGRKVYIEFLEKSGRIDKAFIVSKRDQDYQRLHLRYIEDQEKGMWELFNRSTKELHFREDILTRADKVEEIGAWLIHNRVYYPGNVINLVPNPSYVTFDDIQKLYEAMYDFFSPILKEEIGFDQLLIHSEVVSLFVSINFYVPKQQKAVADFTMVYLNSWGEMLYESVIPEKALFTIEEIQNEILNRIGIKRLPLHTIFYSVKEKNGRKIIFSSGLTRPKPVPCKESPAISKKKSKRGDKKIPGNPGR
ncbi:class I adenylate cyclase [Desulfospira joergensenii]|uniref:class I adenylate cyclase n=1 Tax=Desulfospira joergensenii TaxID=53329 RepID=UPI0003B56F93|nr:class I adenylate cyclase [Desulfospira joergensenii]